MSFLSVGYLSRNTIATSYPEMRMEIARILEASRRNNPRVGVTGVLVYNHGVFCQLLEGPEAAVEETFERIQQDPRHNKVVVFETKRLETRLFPSWSMGFVSAEEHSSAWINSLNFGDLDSLSGLEVFKFIKSLAQKHEHSSVL